MQQQRRRRSGDGRPVTSEAPAGTRVCAHPKARRPGWEEAVCRVHRAPGWREAKVPGGQSASAARRLSARQQTSTRTLHTGWATDPLMGLDVVVVDETGIGHRHNNKLKTTARDAEARPVLVRDPHLRLGTDV